MLLTAEGCGQEEWALGCCPTPLQLLEPACLQHLYSGLPAGREMMFHFYSSKLSQEGLPVQFFVFSPSQICADMKREGNSGSCTHQMNQVSQTWIYQTKEMCMISAFHLGFLWTGCVWVCSNFVFTFCFLKHPFYSTRYDSGIPVKVTEIRSRWCLIWLKIVKLDDKHLLNNCHELLEGGPGWWDLWVLDPLYVKKGNVPRYWNSWLILQQTTLMSSFTPLCGNNL